MKDILQEIQKYEYISFDVFDTLILRNVLKPQDIFRYLEQKVLIQFGNYYEGFAEKRIEAEKRAREISAFEEINLQEIYDVLSNEFPKNELEFIQADELNIELLFSTPNRCISQIFEKCKELHKKIIIITDIYLPLEFMKKILSVNGFSGWDYLYVSCNERATKRYGTLYKKILKDLGIQPNEMVHFGDNINSDVKIAKKQGINGILFSTNSSIRYPVKNCDKLSDLTAKTFINNNLLVVPTEQRIGYECFGPLLYGMSRWIFERVTEERISHIFFLSRDGYIMKKAFDIVCKDSGITGTYFYASRRALRVPLLAYSPSYEMFIKSNYWPQHIVLRYFIKAMGVEEQEAYVDKELNLDYTINRDDIAKDKVFKDTYGKLIKYASNSAQKELEALLLYCQQEGLTGKVAIVDIGWHGNMQLNLSRILKANNISVELVGLYVGISSVQNHKSAQNMSGYVFDIDKNLDLFKREREVNSLFEEIFLAPHGSLKKYELNNNGVSQPVFYPLEQQDEKSVEILSSFQEGGIRFVESFAKYKNYVELSDRFAISGVLQFLLYPKLEDAILWSNIIFKDVDEKKIVTFRKRSHYIRHPITFLRDYKASVWKEGFLKIIFKGNYDYYRWSQSIIKIRYWTHYKFHNQ